MREPRGYNTILIFANGSRAIVCFAFE